MEATSNSVMEFRLFMKLTEDEARALNALTVYGHKAFLEVFYEKLGKAYMENHEKGLVSLFESIKSEIPIHLSRIDKARQAFQENNPKK